MAKLLVIADDFTGALDTGVQFARMGIPTRVITGQTPELSSIEKTCQVLVVDAESRHITKDAAYRVVHRIVSQAVNLQIRYIYKKTDSALRGNIGAELAAVIDASGIERLPFLPAFPQMNRTTVQGVHYISAVPVAQSVFGKDPFEPVTESDVCQLIHLQTEKPAKSYAALKEQGDISQSAEIAVFDAQTPDDLLRTGSILMQADGLRISAGCAGFASFLPEILGFDIRKDIQLPKLDPQFTVICGSVNPITVAQLAYAEKNGFTHINLLPEQKLDAKYWKTDVGRQHIAQLEAMLETSPCRIIDTNDHPDGPSTAAIAAEKGMDIQDVRAAVSCTIGYLVGRLFTHPAIGTMLITGGDTLLQCMEFMGVHEIEPLQEMDAGVVLSRFTYCGVTRHVITKSGGFGKENLLVTLAQLIKSNQEGDR